jgi:uncharacterized protein YyaL (SSP411 family)
MTSEGYLMHTYKDKQARIDGFLEDYALVIEGLLNLHQATFGGRWLKEAIRLANVMVQEFWDESAGMFYDTGTRHQPLFIRPKNTRDGAMPSGSSSATSILMKVGRLTGNPCLERVAMKSLSTMQEDLSRYPLAFANWLCALDLYLSTPQEIAIFGSRNHAATEDLVDAIFSNWNPNRVVAAVDPSDPASFADISLLRNRNMIHDQPTVFLCERNSCRMPVNNPDLLRSQLLESNIAETIDPDEGNRK